MVFADCFSFPEAARLMGISVSTLHRRLGHDGGLTRCLGGHAGLTRQSVLEIVAAELSERGLIALMASGELDLGLYGWSPLHGGPSRDEATRIAQENVMLREVLRSLKMAHVTLADALDAVAPPRFPNS